MPPVVKFALFGHPVGHSQSPRMHTASFRALGFEATYEGFDVAPDALPSALSRCVSEGYRGLNLTIPHKRNVLPLLTHLDASAVRYGAANTVVIHPDGTTDGYNTDVWGFLKDLSERGVVVKDRRVLMLGSGGAGRALACGCREAGCASLVVANRTVREDGVLALGSEACLQAAREADVIVNATPIGLRAEDPAVLPKEAFHSGQFVYDCCPTVHEPTTVRVARAAGAGSCNGLGFLVWQGARAFELWTGRSADIGAMKHAVGL